MLCCQGGASGKHRCCSCRQGLLCSGAAGALALVPQVAQIKTIKQASKQTARHHSRLKFVRCWRMPRE